MRGRPGIPILLDDLKQLGLEGGKRYGDVISGSLPLAVIDQAVALVSLRSISATRRPVNPAGAITSQGDIALRAGVARSIYSVDGSGDGVGDLSDNCTMEINADQRNTDGDIHGNLCDLDFNGNGIVDPVDFSLLKSRFGQPGFPDQDLNGNGVVDPFDFTVLKSMFGQSPGPSAVSP